MKAHCTLEGFKLKREAVRESGEITGHEPHLLVTLKVPAEKIDANALSIISDELLVFELNTAQGQLGT